MNERSLARRLYALAAVLIAALLALGAFPTAAFAQQAD